MTRGKWMGVAIAVAVLGAMMLASLPSSKPPSPNGPIDKITIGSPVYHSMLILLAEEQGYFVGNGLDVTVNLYPYEDISMEKFEHGEGDFTVTSDFTFARTNLKEGRENLRIIASVATVSAQELLARRDHGIREPADLKGKRIGIPLDSVLEYTLDRFLVLHGIAPGVITKVFCSYDRCAEAILQGEVDATVLFDLPLDDVKKRLGADAQSWSTNITQPHYWPLVAKKQTLEAKPGVARRLIRALLEAQAFASAHPDRAEAILTRRWNFSPEFLRRSRKTTKSEISLDQSMIEAMEDEVAWLAEKRPDGEKQVLPNFLRLIDLDALDAVRPKAITILR